MKRWIVLLILLSCLTVTAAGTNFYRHPAPSPDGSRIAFSWRGDIWVTHADGTGTRRLTVHPAYDAWPVWSPDGKWIAFSSRRFGNLDVFIIPSQGGKARRLTFHSANDVVSDFTRDGTCVLFYARYRGDHYYRDPMPYVVPVKGGTPRLLFQDFGNMVKASPDGHTLAYVDHNPPWWRKDYRGAANMDIRLFDVNTHRFSDKLTTFEGNDDCPMWAGADTLYFLSDRDGFVNVWKMDRNGKYPSQVTHIKEKNIAFANIAADGSLITVELNGRILTVDPATGETRELTIQAASDVTENDIQITNESSGASEMVVSPDGRMAAFIVTGDVFVMKTKDGKARNLTQDSYRQRDLAWSPDGRYLYFASDRAGNYDLYRVYSGDDESLYRTLHLRMDAVTRNEADDTGPQIAPDGKTLAFIRGNGDIVLSDLDGKHQRTFLEHWDRPEFSWSPDSRYIAYAVSDNMFNTDIYIRPAAGGKAVNITRHPDTDRFPVWTADGRMLYFLSHRDHYSSDIWYVYLTRAEDQMTEEDRAERKARRKEQKKEAGKRERKTAPVTVNIDFEGIHKRVHKLTRLEGDEGPFAVSHDGETIVFSANVGTGASLWKIKRTGKALKELSGTKQVRMVRYNEKTGKYFFITRSGALRSVTDKGKVERYPYKAKIVTSTSALRRQMYLECWRIMNNRFYDPNFHGVDWAAMKEKYQPLAEAAGCRDDFYDVVRQMIGELNASHLGIYPPHRRPPFQTGELGILRDDHWDGEGIRIRRVLKDTPADREDSKLHAGDIVLAVNGTPVSRDHNFYALLFDQVGERVLLQVKSSDGVTREVAIRPVSPSENNNYLYNDWVARNRKLVTQYSGGRLGYVHIRSMNQASYDRFQQEVYTEGAGKDGLIVDVRNNGGGWTTDILLRIIGQKQHAFTIPRNGGKGYPDMERKQVFLWTKPMVVTCNEGSYSNAEIFSHAVHTLGLAKLVGMPTFGAVISTGGTTLIDGSYFRIPFRGWYVAGTGKNMENGPAIPDYLVPTQPEDEAKGVDRQLKKAVQVLLGQLH